MDLNEIAIFSQVVKAGSFTAAAHQLGIPKSTVSRKVSELEARLNAQLLQRTTRQLHLTDAGRTYARYAARVVAEIEEAELAVSRMQETPRGLLRISAPLSMAFLGPTLQSFLARYPLTQLELVCTDRLVDLVNEGFDVAIRAGRLVDSSLIARPLGSVQNVPVASATFLAEHKAPRTPKDLARLPCLVFGAGSQRSNWTLVKKGNKKEDSVTVQVSTRLIANDFEVLRDACVAGHGVALLPHHLIDKRLIRLLPGWCTAAVPLHVVYSGARLLSPKVKAFAEHMRETWSLPITRPSAERHAK